VAEIPLERVSKVFPDGTRAVSSLDLDVGDGEFMILVGPSGCGKTTALRMVAGLEDVSAGVIRIGGRVVNHVLPKDRDVAMVFQSYALYPFKSVYDNMAFALKLKKVDRAEIDRRVRDAARILHLTELLQRRPRQLSGGQRQRVAMGRAIVREPQAFLMDEPLSNLDAKLRVQMRAEIARIQRGLGVTTIYVTHDQVEAMTMGDRVAVMRFGEMQQVDTPQDLYDRPSNLFVAEFIGSPAMNVVEATLDRADGRLVARFGRSALAVDERLAAGLPGLAAYDGRKVLLGFRPEHLEDASLAPGAGPMQRIRARCDLREALGSEVLLHFGLDATTIVLEDATAMDEGVATDASGGGGSEDEAPQGAEARLVARVSPECPARRGDWIELAVNTARLHFFDPETERAIGPGGSRPPDGAPVEGSPDAVPAPPGTTG